MLAVFQRVAQARVEVAAEVVGRIGRGALLLVCAQPQDTPQIGLQLLHKVLKLRVFADAAGKMNHSLQDLDGAGTPGGLLVVSQFTLAADTRRGNRPGFSGAAEPELARRLYEDFVAQARRLHPQVQTGVFAADMQVHLVNDGPVTIPLQVGGGWHGHGV